jgi:hypothetical protein
MSLSRVKYAFCKHGCNHESTRCGFAHRVSEIEFPAGASAEKYWRCFAHRKAGPSGIDRFVGQEYSSDQTQRVLMYVVNHSIHTLPPWARMLCWFLRLYPEEFFLRDGCFQLKEDLQGIASYYKSHVSVVI